MKSVKYIGLDVHHATISIAVLDANGKLVMQSVIATQASTILDFIRGVRGELHVTLEEGTSAHWLYGLWKPHVDSVMVCDARKSALMNAGNKSDRIDARELAKLLRGGQLSAVFHEEVGVRTLRELARSYLTLTQDVTRVMNRIKGVYRSQAIPSAGKSVYTKRHRLEWLEQLQQPGQRRRADRLYAQLDLLQPLRQQARRELLEESRKYPIRHVLQQIPVIGPIRAALLIALIQTPHRFRTKRLLWTYSGLGVKTESSGDYDFKNGDLRQKKKYCATRGLKQNHNHDLKYLFKSMAQAASMTAGPLQDYYRGLLAKGTRPEMARPTLARKLAAVVLILWKKGASFDPTKLTTQAA
jgi:transposase